MNVGQMKEFLKDFDDDTKFFVPDGDHLYREAYISSNTIVKTKFNGEYVSDGYMEDGEVKITGIVIE